ncbi:hypothetical protein AMTRI_Chr04g182910 [Amborella trichopoda]
MSNRSKEIIRIYDKNKRYVSWSKRKGGLFKKAGKFAPLTGAEVGIMINSKRGRLFTGNPLIDDIITKYLQAPNYYMKYVSFLRGLREKASILPKSGNNNVNLDSVESSHQTLYQENSHEDLTSTSSLPYSMDLIHQQSVENMNIHLCSGEYGPKHSYPEDENVEMGCSFGLSEISDLNHRGSINAMNVCFSNGECEALFFSSLDLSETSDWNHLGSINYMNFYLCNGEFRPKSLYPQDENIEMGCSFGLFEISDLNHHGSINDMNVCCNNGEYEPLFMCSEDDSIGMSNSLGLSEIVVGIILEHEGYEFLLVYWEVWISNFV